MITTILPNMIPMRDIKQISDGDRLFYELGQLKKFLLDSEMYDLIVDIEKIIEK